MISAVILAKNEEKNIGDCIQSLSFCDEVIVIDDNSSDKTRDIAKKVGASVLSHTLDNNFSVQRNFGLEKAKGEWVLFIDADERVSKDLADEIVDNVSNNTSADGFFLSRVDIMHGKQLQYGETSHISLLRLARKDAGRWNGTVHEMWQIKGKTEVLKSPLLHYPHPTIGEFLEEVNFYTDLRAQELYRQKVRVSWISIILYPKMKFMQNYLVKRGFLDGTAGLIMAFMMSFHSFLVRGKLWQLWDQKTSSQ